MRCMLALGLALVVGCASSQIPEEKAAKLAKEGLDLAERGKTTEALEKYEEALELVPGWTKVRFDYARLNFEKGQTHFFNALQARLEAEGARGASLPEQARDKDIIARKEKDTAEGLLDRAEEELRKVIKSQTNRDHEFNGYLYLAHIYALRENWQEGKKYYQRALDMAPQADARDSIIKAIHLMNEEIDRAASEEIGPKPE